MCLPNIMKCDKIKKDAGDPPAIIINIENILANLSISEEKLFEAELHRGDLIESALMFICDKELAEDGIASFAEDLYCAAYREFGKAEATAIKEAANTVAKGLFEHLENIGAYKSNGELPYTEIGFLSDSCVLLIPHNEDSY